jgi:hypothetical protein
VSNGSRSLWETFTTPLLVGLILAVATYAIPRIFEAGKRLSFSVEKPTNYLSHRLQGVTVQVNGVPTSDLFVENVRVWNSGSIALKNVGVAFVFNTSDPNFKMLNVSHSTKPEREFGEITQTTPDDRSWKFAYSLLNRKDEDVISFLTNEAVIPSVFCKAEDLIVTQVSPNREETTGRPFGMSMLIWTAILGFVASLLSISVTVIRQRHHAEVDELRQTALKRDGAVRRYW